MNKLCWLKNWATFETRNFKKRMSLAKTNSIAFSFCIISIFELHYFTRTNQILLLLFAVVAIFTVILYIQMYTLPFHVKQTNISFNDDVYNDDKKKYILDFVWRKKKETPTKSRRKMFISKSFIADSHKRTHTYISSLCTLYSEWWLSLDDECNRDRCTHNRQTHTQHVWSKRKTDEIMKIIVAMFCFKC